MTAQRTPADIETDRQAIADRLALLFKTEKPEGTTHVRWDELATLCGVDIHALQAANVPGASAEAQQLSEAERRIAASRARIAEAEAAKLERIADQVEAEASATRPPPVVAESENDTL